MKTQKFLPTPCPGGRLLFEKKVVKTTFGG